MKTLGVILLVVSGIFFLGLLTASSGAEALRYAGKGMASFLVGLGLLLSEKK